MIAIYVRVSTEEQAIKGSSIDSQIEACIKKAGTKDVLKYVETVSYNINQAQLQQRAKVKQAQKKGVKKELKSIQAIGIPDLQSGLPVYISIPEVGVKKTYWVDTDKHEFKGSTHMMTIDVVEKNSIPDGVSL
ncbi:hypothetical protein DFO69_1697 [Bacillus subtilis]|nr:hypothetical protein DFO69_1697 [Bacillus subtilis]TYS24252.1 hypothetical protein FZC71_05875 [Bacillus subtilis]